MNTTETYDFDTVMDNLMAIGQRFADADKMEELTDIVEATLGVGRKVSQCTKKQLDALVIILDDLTDKAQELGI